ncbi:MAG: phosphatidylserine decarboxylase family protein [Deltaproteobacteria bacterium]|nr:phosphatidylserine decarboxylase family protein [Deltaproteobacteria bacterium]
MKIRREGFPFIFGSGLLSLVLARLGLGIVGLIPVAFVTWFFRDPEREVPAGEGLVISPADGTVLDVVNTDEEQVGPCTKISIFMSVFNVHVNRSPVSGTVVGKHYRSGTFHMANLGKKTEANERMILYIENQDGVFRVDQVAGLVARRISCMPEEGDKVEAGQRIGLIRFGSLLECYMPVGYTVAVSRGQTVFAGETVIGGKKE